MLRHWLNKLGCIALALALAVPAPAQEFNIFLPYNVVSAPACTAVSVAQTDTHVFASASSISEVMSIGTANAQRYIVVSEITQNGSLFNVSSLTVAGQAATEKIDVSSGDIRGSLWITDAPVTTGTTATVAITWAGTVEKAGIAVWAVTCPSDPDPVASGGATASDVTVTSGALSATLNIPTNGVGIGHNYCESSSTFNWTNLTEAFDEVTTDAYNHTGATSSSSGSATRTATAAGGTCAGDIGVLLLASWGRDTTVRLYPATCVANAAAAASPINPAAFQAITVPNLSDSASVNVVVAVLLEDSASNFSVSSMTIDGNAATERADEDGTGAVNAALYSTSAAITGAASLNVSVSASEAVTSAVVCVWALQNLSSSTPTSSNFDDDTNSAALVLTLSSTTSGGYAVGACIGTATADTVAWAVLTEREDTQHAEADYSNADGATTGSSMSVTCDFTNSNDNSGVAGAFR